MNSLLVRSRPFRLLLVLAGILLGQAILYGPSLIGKKILLPLDILTSTGIYLPTAPNANAGWPLIENIYLSDLIYVAEPTRYFAASEYRAGRLPQWTPSQYAGAPLLAPKFSPVLGLQYLTTSPVSIAWAQVVVALVAGFGAYAFCRRALEVSFWPAAVIAWCYPLSGFFVFWQGYWGSPPVCWLPWMLLAVDRSIRGRSRLARPAIALATGATLLSGALDVAGQVLLASGLYALWCLYDTQRWRWFDAQARRAILSVSFAWVLGLLLAAPHVWPIVEYSQTGSRIASRGGGAEERPPTGLAALPQVVLPDIYGAFGVMKTGSFRTSGDSQQESSAAAYAGLAATLLAAPLAFADKRRRARAVCLAGLAVLGLAWQVNLPGVVQLLRLPGLNMMSHNRLVFLAGFALLALAAVGLETLRREPLEWRRWLWLPPALVGMLYVFCSYRALFLPEPIATQLEQTVLSGRQIGWIRDVESVRVVQDWYVRHYTAGAILCGLTLAGWVAVWLKKSWQPRLIIPLGVLLMGDLLWVGYGRSVQSDPALYFPKLPALEQLRRANPGRVIGTKCLPAMLSAMCGLDDVRGYDGVDPAEYVELLRLASDPAIQPLPYAAVQWLSPMVDIAPEGDARLSPILNLLGVTHVIFRGTPPPSARPAFQSDDYWVLRNPGALPRVFVPEKVEVVPDKAERLRRLASPDFDPRHVAFLEAPAELSTSSRGMAEMMKPIPTRILVKAEMESRGLLVLADRWDKGWRAKVNRQPVPILRVDHALRGVVVPAGSSTVEFEYSPQSFKWGLLAAGLAGIGLVVWFAIGGKRIASKID